MAVGESHPSLPTISRSLVTPGPMLPSTHFGITLFRHVVSTGLRYSLYQLGMPIPDAPPVRLTGLRLFLDSVPLNDLLAEADGGAAILRALLSPSSCAVEELPQGPAIAAALHRTRLRWLPRVAPVVAGLVGLPSRPLARLRRRPPSACSVSQRRTPPRSPGRAAATARASSRSRAGSGFRA